VREDEIVAALDRAAAAVASGRGLRGTGFWAAVGAVRRDRALAERYAAPIAEIDRQAFERGVRLRVPLGAGLALLGLGTLAGLVAVAGAFFYGWDGALCGFASPCEATLGPSLVFLAGFAAVHVCTHSLTHWLVGRAVGIRFTHVFVGGPPPPRPGLKIDYATYLRVPPRRRALMHASGAVVTKLVPFAFGVPAVLYYFGWNWLTILLFAIGGFQIVTDVLLSTKLSDWKKVRRELRAARRY
jgi:hypothetical protein